MRTYVAIDQQGNPHIIEQAGDDHPRGYAILMDSVGPVIIGTKSSAQWNGKCNVTSEGVDVEKWLWNAVKGISPQQAYAAIEAAAKQRYSEQAA